VVGQWRESEDEAHDVIKENATHMSPINEKKSERSTGVNVDLLPGLLALLLV
jgi:hypothetical protein